MNHNLLKTDDAKQILSNEQDILFKSKRKIRSICKALSLDASEYLPEKGVKSIQGYIDAKTNKERILYSEISSFVFGLNENDRGTVSTNIDNLVNYALDDSNKVSEDCSRIIIKIYDHFHLALNQKELTSTPKEIIENAVSEGLIDVMDEFKKETKDVETKYITILGIFASIVLAFVGGLTFSSSVLQNINAVSIYRLLIVIDLLGVVLTNTIYILIRFICKINNKGMERFGIKKLNIFFAVLAGIIVVAWLLSARSVPAFLSQFLPWLN
ncbi:MAG: hypothetical protein IJO92_02180 [Clostridia bacterium]|nr:hypothetical protein [Clostridia bacterium]